jgi:hypothetical protein
LNAASSPSCLQQLAAGREHPSNGFQDSSPSALLFGFSDIDACQRPQFGPDGSHSAVFVLDFVLWKSAASNRD